MTKEEVHGLLMRVPGMTEELAGRLFDAGFTDRQKLYDASTSELDAVEGIDASMANNIQSIVRKGVLVGDAKKEEAPAQGAQTEGAKKPAAGIMGMVMGIVNAIIGLIKRILDAVIGVFKGKKAPEGAASAASAPKVSEAPPEPAPPSPPDTQAAPPTPAQTPPSAPAPARATAAPAPTAAPSAGRTSTPSNAGHDDHHPRLEETISALVKAFEITEAEAQSLALAGFTDVERVRKADLISLAEVDGITLATAKKIQSK